MIHSFVSSYTPRHFAADTSESHQHALTPLAGKGSFVIACLIGVLCFIAPLCYPTALRPLLHMNYGFEFGSVSLFRFLFIVTMTAIITITSLIIRSHERPKSDLTHYLFLFFCIWGLIATVLSPSWATSLFGILSRFDGFLTYLCFGLIFFAVSSHTFTPQTIKRLMQIIVITGVITSVYGLLQLTSLPFISQAGVYYGRITSLFGNPNSFGGFVIIPFAFSCCFMMLAGVDKTAPTQSHRLQSSSKSEIAGDLVFGLISSVIMLSAIFVTMNRSTWLAALLVLLFTIIARALICRSLKPLLLLGAIVIIGALCFGIGSFLSPEFHNRVIARLGSLDHLKAAFEPRLYIWIPALQGMLDKPLFGWGFDTFTQVEALHYKAGEVTYYGDINNLLGDSAHNIFLQIGTSVGFPGLVCFIAFIICVLVRAFMLMRTDYTNAQKSSFVRSDDSALPASGCTHVQITVLVIAILGHLIQAFFVPDSLMGNVNLFIACGFIVSTYASHKPSHMVGRLTITMQRVVGVLISVILLCVVCLTIVSNHFALQAENNFEQDERVNWNKACTFNPLVSDYLRSDLISRAQEIITGYTTDPLLLTPDVKARENQAFEEYLKAGKKADSLFGYDPILKMQYIQGLAGIAQVIHAQSPSGNENPLSSPQAKERVLQELLSASDEAHKRYPIYPYFTYLRALALASPLNEGKFLDEAEKLAQEARAQNNGSHTPSEELLSSINEQRSKASSPS